VSGTAEVKYKSKKTNPNARVMGCDENYLSIKDYKLESGRGFSQNELERAAWVVIIGQEIKTTLFDRLDPLNQYISVLGGRYKVVGVLEKQGGMMGSSADRMIMLPVETARRVAGGQDLTYDITVAVKDPTQLETIMGEARAHAADPARCPRPARILRNQGQRIPGVPARQHCQLPPHRRGRGGLHHPARAPPSAS
jgi:putative ABC transport system permease protein